MRLHISNLSPTTTEVELKLLFGKYGTVLKAEIEWRRKAGKSSGVAIVDMNMADAMVAARELSGRAFRSRRLYITLMRDVRATTNSPLQYNRDQAPSRGDRAFD